MMGAEMEKDKRSYPRSNVSWPVTLITSTGTTEGRTKNVSAIGAFIHCQEVPDPADDLFLSVKLPAGSPLEVSAKVVWSNSSTPEDTTTPRGIGVRFLW